VIRLSRAREALRQKTGRQVPQPSVRRLHPPDTPLGPFEATPSLDRVIEFIPILALFHFSTSDLTHLLDHWGYPLVTLFVGIESSGIPFPGETMLVTAAVYAGSGHLSIAGVIFAATLGAIVGDNIGYTAGRYAGRALLTRYGRYIRLKKEHLDYAERFFKAHGDKTVFLGRFIAVLRAWAAFLAGTNKMPWPKFLFFNAAGGITWATVYGMLGYTLGNNLPLLRRVISVLGVAGVALVVLIAVVAFVVWRLRSSKEEKTPDTSAKSNENNDNW
jgi:membrane protein DedA with SNARE-associated domain